MSEGLTFHDLKDINFDEDEPIEFAPDKSQFRQYSKEIALTIGYLLGVSEESALKRIDEPDEYFAVKEKLEKDENAVSIRHLNNIRSNLILEFKNVSRALRDITADYKPLDKMDMFKEDFKVLKRFDINVYGGHDINKYIQGINTEIQKRIDKVEKYFPDWVKFKNIRSLFIMPQNIEEESKKFQLNQGFYPFQRYMFWRQPEESGYVLATDSVILTIAYQNNAEIFEDHNKVMDASDATKNNISDFINRGEKVQIFIDGENADPYKLASTISGLEDYQIRKIDKIVVYYDQVYSTKAWQYLQHFVFGVPVDAIPVTRIHDEKSLVDHRFVAGVAKAVYLEKADSIILVSSDSDFWTVIESITEANYMVMVETDKCSRDFKNLLREHDVFYCYLDKFKTMENNKFFKTVFRKELEESIKDDFHLGNARTLLGKAITRSRAEISDAEKDSVFEKYIKGLKLVIDTEGNFQILIPE